MDIEGLPDIGQITDAERVVTALRGCAETVDGAAGRLPVMAKGEWRGAAADAFADRVAGHREELLELAEQVRHAARRVRDLETTARERLATLERLAAVEPALPDPRVLW